MQTDNTQTDNLIITGMHYSTPLQERSKNTYEYDLSTCSSSLLAGCSKKEPLRLNNKVITADFKVSRAIC